MYTAKNRRQFGEAGNSRKRLKSVSQVFDFQFLGFLIHRQCNFSLVSSLLQSSEILLPFGFRSTQLISQLFILVFVGIITSSFCKHIRCYVVVSALKLKCQLQLVGLNEMMDKKHRNTNVVFFSPQKLVYRVIQIMRCSLHRKICKSLVAL